MATTRRQAEYLAGSGDRVTVVAAEPPADWQGVDYLAVPRLDSRVWRFAEYLAEGISRRLPPSLRRLSLAGFVDKYRFPYSAARTIARMQPNLKIDACVCCQHFGANGLAAAGLPFALVAHGDIFDHPPDAFSPAVAALYRRSAVLSYRTARHVITVSRSLRDRAITCGAAPDWVTVIPNGICADDLSGYGAESDARAADMELLFVGRLAAEKAVDVALRAVARLHEPMYRLRVIGDGPERGKLESLAAKLGLDGRVEFLGYRPRHSLRGYYETADVVLLPSLCEANPVVLLESQLCGRPIIASRVGGVPDVVTHGSNGLLVPPGDDVALAEAILQLWNDPSQRQAMSVRARQKAAEFSWPSLLEAFTTVVHRSFSSGDVPSPTDSPVSRAAGP